MDIIQLFQYHQKLKFSEIEKALKVRSNKLAYHLTNLTKKGILIKENEYYLLSKTAEKLIPYISDKNTPLPVLLINLGNKRKTFLWSRNKRPFKEMLSLPGGRILVGESIKEATSRILKKFNIYAKLNQIHSISLEHVKEKNKNILHSFILILVSAKTKDKIELIDLEKNKKKIISSDYNLLKNNLDKKIEIKDIITKKF